MEQLDYNPLFRWFVGLTMDNVARASLEQVLAAARAQHLLSNEHFSVDGTLIEAWASPGPPGSRTPRFSAGSRS